MNQASWLTYAGCLTSTPPFRPGVELRMICGNMVCNPSAMIGKEFRNPLSIFPFVRQDFFLQFNESSQPLLSRLEHKVASVAAKEAIPDGKD